MRMLPLAMLRLQDPGFDRRPMPIMFIIGHIPVMEQKPFDGIPARPQFQAAQGEMPRGVGLARFGIPDGALGEGLGGERRKKPLLVALEFELFAGRIELPIMAIGAIVLLTKAIPNLPAQDL